ncbi:MAG: ABC transporter substrate-binding protein [Gammaproteobacteria bacterium]|nr:ABC transporter substrate-binding protein [Gammaproteobacteria bacterium]
MIKLQFGQLINALIISVLLISSVVMAAEIEPPVDMLKRVSDDVIKVLKEKREAIDADPNVVYQIVDEHILPHLDDVTLAKLALGKNWNKANNEQKIEFVDQFRTLLIRTYSKSLQEFRDQTINFSPLNVASGEDKVTVKSEVLQSGGPAIPVDYRLRLKDNEWKVYDIIIDGVSLVTNYRGTFTQEMRKGGIEAVLKMLQDKNARVAEKPVTPETTNSDESQQKS